MSKTIIFACRIVVVLAFVITIPLIALFGKSLPEVAETVWGLWKKPAQENHWADTEEAPPFTPAAAPSTLANEKATPQPLVSTPTIPAANLQISVPKAQVPQTQPLAVASPSNTTASPYANQAANWNYPVGATAQVAPQYGNSAANLGTAPSYNPATAPRTNPETPNPAANNANTPTHFNNPAAGPLASPTQQQPVHQISPPPASPAQQNPHQNSAFEQISQRLQQLGATYYRLESWGNGKPLFRFQCRMAITGNSGLTRQFEATHQDPAEAMRQVLRQIETWQQSQRSASRASSPGVPNVRNAPNALR